MLWALEALRLAGPWSALLAKVIPTWTWTDNMQHKLDMKALLTDDKPVMHGQFKRIEAFFPLGVCASIHLYQQHYHDIIKVPKTRNTVINSTSKSFTEDRKT